MESWRQYFKKIIDAVIGVVVLGLFMFGVGVGGDYVYSTIKNYFNIFDTLYQLKNPKTSNSLSQFYQNSIYYQIQKQVGFKIYYKYKDDKIPLLYGRQHIGKTQNIIHLVNKEIQQNLPVFFFSFKSTDFSESSQQNFFLYLQQNNNWNQIKKWRKQSQEWWFNRQFKKMFGNSSLTVVIDEINYISKYCTGSKCDWIVHKFINQLDSLRQKGARIIALSSDSNHQYLSDISTIGNAFLTRAITLQPKENFNKMFKDYKLYDQQLKNYILDHYSSRGEILQILKVYQNKYNNDKNRLKKHIQVDVQDLRVKLFQGNKFKTICQNKLKTAYQQSLRQVCLQIQNTDQIKSVLKIEMNEQDILYKNEFKNKLYARAFQQYSLKSMNQTIRCKQFLELQKNENAEEQNYIIARTQKYQKRKKGKIKIKKRKSQKLHEKNDL